MGVGGKGAGLRRLERAGLAVPTFAVVDTGVLAALLQRAGLTEALDREARDPDGDPAGLIAGLTLDRDAREAILAAYAAVGGGPVAVRSSAVAEDGARHSFAGQGETFLDVDGDGAVVAAVRGCWASAWGPRALRYRTAHGLPRDGIETAVVIQRMIPAEASGVAFTCNPVTGAADEMVISAGRGAGAAVLDLAADVETCVVERASGRVRERSGPTVLDPETWARIRAAALAVDVALGGPQDVEWAIAGGDVWIVQARPITATGGTSPDDGPMRLWDNANIVESFGDVTAPLTFSFARHAYGRVYRDYCRFLGVPRARLAHMDRYVTELLGCFDGRVYYNVFHWWMILSLVPGSSIQRKVLAVTAGVAEASPEIVRGQRPFRDLPLRTERALHARTAVVFAWRFVTTGRAIRRFLREFDAVEARFDRAAVRGRPAATNWAAYLDLEERALSTWGPTAVLDAVLSLSLGILHALISRWLADAPPWLLWEAVAVRDASVASVIPADRLLAISDRVRADPPLAALVAGSEPRALPEVLAASGLPAAAALRAEMEEYLAAFGDRAIDDLKLEAPDLHDDPEPAWGMLRDAVIRPPAGPRAPASAERDADAWVAGRLRGPRRLVYAAVRAKVRRTLRAREDVRFARSRAFAAVRVLLREIGVDLARQGLLDAPDDVLFLHLEEVRGAFAGTVDRGELAALADLRRRRHAEHLALPAPPSRFFTYGLGAPVPDAARTDETAGTVLRGRPSCPGIVIGEAQVVEHPRDVSGRILVAYRTDPGWVGALASASALVLERGTPLTHVAVVARELGVPTVVQVPGVTAALRDGGRVRVDGGAGTVEILAPAAPDPTPHQEELPA